MGIDILGIDILGVDILGIDIPALPHACGGCICTCIYMHACRVHDCVMPYPGLAVYIFLVFTVVS